MMTAVMYLTPLAVSAVLGWGAWLAGRRQT